MTISSVLCGGFLFQGRVLFQEGEAPAGPLSKARQEPRPPEWGWPPSKGRGRRTECVISFPVRGAKCGLPAAAHLGEAPGACFRTSLRVAAIAAVYAACRIN